ncbi:MAG: hypothetical protein MJ064_00830 [Lachnospiraceae bacterium]|nr:hypothetical protein [Lachnospiraceae bacterium]
MKKLVLLVMSLMMVVALCACGEKGETESKTRTKVEKSQNEVGDNDETEPKTETKEEESQNEVGDNDLNQHIDKIHPEFVSLKENANTVYLRSNKETDKSTIYEETIYNKKGDMVLADYFKRVEVVDEANADAQVQEWKDMLDRFGFEYVSVEYVDGKVVVEYCTTNITGILSIGVIPDIEQEKNLREMSGSECQIIE